MIGGREWSSCSCCSWDRLATGSAAPWPRVDRVEGRVTSLTLGPSTRCALAGMLTRSLVQRRAILQRAFLSTSRPAPSPPPPAAPAPAHPTATRTTRDALYADQGPSAAAENATSPASFPYGQPLASSSSSTPPPPPAPSPDPVTTAATTEQAPSQLPLLGLEPETPVQEAPVARSRRPVGAFRGGSVPSPRSPLPHSSTRMN